jgi:hypothetical protein
LLALHRLLINFLKLGCLTNISKMSLPDNDSLPQNDNFIRMFCEIGSMSRHNHCLISQIAEDALSDKKLTNMDINCADDVVQQEDVFIGVESSSEGDPCLLTSR